MKRSGSTSGNELVPELMEGKDAGEPLRVWCAACASGEEAYSAAMVLAEALGIDQYCDRVKIYGTDVDEDALAIARQGIYDAKQVEPVPRELRDRYFEMTNARYTFRARPAAHRHLRPQRPRAGRADLARRPAHLP